MRKIIVLSFLFLFIFLFYKNILNYENFDEKIEKKIHEIKIHNLENIDKDMILKKINLKVGQSFWNFSSKELVRDLKKIKGIKSFSFKMENDGILNIVVVEDIPFMVWKFSNKIKYLNEKGEILEFSKKNFKDLIILEGNVEPKILSKFNAVLNENTELKKIF